MKFSELNLKETLLKAIEEMGFESPTPIQELAVPALLEYDADVVAQAQTGTGKTAAFALPLLEQIDKKVSGVQAIILAPTRELALQVQQEIERLSKYEKVRSLSIYGGVSYDKQIQSLRNLNPQIITGTPGRVIDLIDRGVLDLSKVRFAILDEADEMLKMGFLEDVQHILSGLAGEHRTWMFSATVSGEIRNLIDRFFNNTKFLKVESQTLHNPNIEQSFFALKRSQRPEALCRVLKGDTDVYGIIFCRTKQDTRDLGEYLQMKGFEIGVLNGDMGQNERNQVLTRFKSGRTRLMICTDVAARGIDVNDITHVFNIGLPQDMDSYVHRIGRTGRAGKDGKAISFIDHGDVRKIRVIERMTKGIIKPGKFPTVEELKLKVVDSETARLEPTINVIKEKGDDFASDELIAHFTKGLADLSKEDIIKLMFTRLLSRELKSLERLSQLDIVEAKTAKGPSTERSGGKIRQRSRSRYEGERNDRGGDRSARGDRPRSDRTGGGSRGGRTGGSSAGRSQGSAPRSPAPNRSAKRRDFRQ